MGGSTCSSTLSWDRRVPARPGGFPTDFGSKLKGAKSPKVLCQGRLKTKEVNILSETSLEEWR